MKRTRIVPNRPNKLFEEWLEKWRDDAIQRNSNYHIGLTKALSSLKKYPLKLNDGRDCIILEHFGKKLCDRIDAKLAAHLAGRDNRIADKHQVEDDLRSFSKNHDDADKNTDTRRKNKPNPNIILNNADNLKKSQDVPTQPKLQQHIAVNTAVQKGPDFLFKPNSFDVILLVDIHETNGVKDDKDPTIIELKKSGILFESRHLNVGDFTWIARCKTSGKELVLPYIVERKRIDDLSSSIKDGRFREQKFRLKRCAIKNIIYLVEHHSSFDKMDVGLPLSSLRQATTNTLIQDEFTVRYTRNHRDSMLYLSTITLALGRLYMSKELVQCDKENLPSLVQVKEKTIHLLEFSKFHHAGAKIKALRVKDMFVRQLVKLKGLSLEKVCAIIRQYPSPLALKNAMKNDSVSWNSGDTRIPDSIAKMINQLYTFECLK